MSLGSLLCLQQVYQFDNFLISNVPPRDASIWQQKIYVHLYFRWLELGGNLFGPYRFFSMLVWISFVSFDLIGLACFFYLIVLSSGNCI
jgi:hypothetical protein